MSHRNDDSEGVTLIFGTIGFLVRCAELYCLVHFVAKYW